MIVPTATAPTAAIQDAVLSSIKQSQELAASSIAAWTEFAGKAFPLPTASELPFSSAIPEAREVVDATFAFAEEVLALQKNFSVKVLDSLAIKATK